MDHPLIKELQDNELYGQFFAEDFDPSRFANNIIQGSSIADSLEQLSAGIGRLETELHTQVIAHHDDLLIQATGIQQLEDVLKMVSSRVSSLSGSIERINDKVQKPYAKIVARTAQLMRLQSACELLRRTLRYTYLAKRLKGHMAGGTKEIAKAANTLTEITALTDSVDLSGIDVVATEKEWIGSAKTQISESANKILNLSIETQNQVQLGTALQVFRSLGQLESKVNSITEGNTKTVIKAISALIGDPSFKDTNSGGTSLAARRASLWTRMEKFMDLLFSTTVQVRHLERVLAKKRDHNTQSSYLIELRGNADMAPVESWWASTMATIGVKFSALEKSCPFIEATFQSEYPKLLRFFAELCARIGKQTSVDGVSSSDADMKEALSAISTFETKYLSHSLNRMFDPVQLVFPSGGKTPPSVDEVVNICKTLQKELHVTSLDQRLSQLVAKNVAKTAKLYFVKTESMLSNEDEDLKVGGDISSAQLRNISLANRLDQIFKGLRAIINSQLGSSLSEEAVQTIELTVTDGESLVDMAVDPLFAAVQSFLERMVRQIHYEDYAASDYPPPPAPEDGEQDESHSCSSYMSNLQLAVQQVQSNVFMRLTCKSATTPRTIQLVKRLLDLFVRHVSLISHLSDAGKMRLASDMAQLELAFAPFDCSATDLGDSYKALRAMRPLLFQAPDEIAKFVESSRVIPMSVTLLHLFTYAPDDMVPPHNARGWTLEQFSGWIDKHSEEEVVSIIKSAVDTYAARITERGDKSFHMIYPIMMRLCESPNKA